MKAAISRIKLTESSIFKTINDKRKIDLTFVELNTVKLEELNTVIREIKDRQFPAMSTITDFINSGAFKFCWKKDSSSSIIYMPILPNTKGSTVDVSGVVINLSAFAKKKSLVDSDTGDIKEILDINYDVFFNLCFGAAAIMRNERILSNPIMIKSLRSCYVDIVGQLLQRSFGNPIYGDRFRFIISYFFHNGEIEAAGLAASTGFDDNKLRVLMQSHPEFFDRGRMNKLTINDMLDVMKEEFSNMKDISLDKLIVDSAPYLGSSGIYILDNIAYLLAVAAIKCRNDRTIFNGRHFSAFTDAKSIYNNALVTSM